MKYSIVFLISVFFTTTLNAGFITRTIGGFALKTGLQYGKKKSIEYGKKRFYESSYGKSLNNTTSSIKNSYYGKKVTNEYNSAKQIVTKKVDDGAGIIAKRYNVEKKDVYSVADTAAVTTKLLYKAQKRTLDIDDYQQIYFNANPIVIKERTASIQKFWNNNLDQF